MTASNASIAQTVGVVVQGIETGQEVYSMILKAMDAAQKEKKSGADKKAWVVAYIKSILNDLGENWEKWLSVVISFIDFAKAFYKQ